MQEQISKSNGDAGAIPHDASNVPKSEEFWSRLDSAMTAKNWRAAALTRATHGKIKESTIAHWKSGHSGPSVEQLAAAAKALGVSMDELWGLREMPDLAADAGQLSKPESDIERFSFTIFPT